MAPSNLRETVLKASVHFIAEHGADGLSFRQVAAAAGVSHQAPYHHFADRKAIFRAIAMEGFTEFGEALRKAVASPDAGIALFEAYVEFALSHRGHFRVMFRRDLCEMENDPELEAVADASFDVLVDHVRSTLGPKASIDEIRARATSMWALAHGLATLLIDGPLEEKIGPIKSRRALIHAVAIQSIRS